MLREDVWRAEPAGEGRGDGPEDGTGCAAGEGGVEEAGGLGYVEGVGGDFEREGGGGAGDEAEGFGVRFVEKEGEGF